MKKLFALVALSLLLASCGAKTPQAPQKTYTCETIKQKIESIQVTGRSGSDESQAMGGAVGMEAGAMVWIIGWPVWSVVGAVVWGIGGAILWTMDRANDYTVKTASGTFICQEKTCESITGEDWETDGNEISKKICEYK